ncbi:MAG: 30S ribosomal protein S9 [Candidatus Harrisonbacteria bacterium CG10_big_fil_rev_8_21_14_0_10_38_8]|uniref:Small ribosomal subunit protein uS9 n=1 Tax=Candidatus Harrisonbacteria bacterium CG10_big_fil_rev_8_21_14_0_10_38_8 TaxID=1974582 RepID=A0A2M6WJJ4_9BACT|nr:MAG: 30S ribosomal protein S9 [Candidatus Harrisonbacteria bacterium CG10_big_fil_rev_8_21_14_0_10_38_8]
MELKGKYYKGKGGRKTSTAQVRIYPKKTGFIINGKDYKEYFSQEKYQEAVTSPLQATSTKEAFGISALVKGGGKTGQAEAVRHGLSLALVEFDAELKPRLRKEGFITRDQRAVERKKPGLKKARKRPQWSKR